LVPWQLAAHLLLIWGLSALTFQPGSQPNSILRVFTREPKYSHWQNTIKSLWTIIYVDTK
jgi:hypothetical protein